jgi:hypothetical protein
MAGTRSVGLSVVFLIGCAVGGAASSRFVAPPARAGTNPTGWEHYCFYGDKGVTEKANELGAQGWEMVAGAGAGAGAGITAEMEFIWCFKREKL